MPENPDHADAMSDDEFAQLASLLARFAETRLDQWTAWQLTTSHGTVFVDVSRQLSDGHHRAAYASIWPLSEPDPTTR